uniref:Lipase maturation factor n=1 Tax=Amphimedon queenslandica TaxID=400682 RepID=A0A1X7TW92_AMPQE
MCRYSWKSQLLEMGFFAMFLSPVYSYSQFPRHTPTSWTNVWGNRWMIFHIMIGAGLIKMRGDSCWRDLTCMNYHYE